MTNKKIKFFSKNLIGIFIFFIIYISELFCYGVDSDFEYPMKMRLNNGHYLVMTSSGIYLYNEEFTSKKDIKLFDHYMIDNNNQIYSADLAQFLSEDNGYIVCLLLNETFIISKSGEYLTNFTIDYAKIGVGIQIVPYGHSNNDYYYAILMISGQAILPRRYIYNSENNEVKFDKQFYYGCECSKPYEYLTCELMKYQNKKVIICFYGNWGEIYKVVFETEFNTIFQGKINIDGITGGRLYVSSINSLTREFVTCCTQREKELYCFGYYINNNTFTIGRNITNDGCRQENIELKVEFFPETEEFLLGCKSGDNDYYIGKLNSNNNFVIYDKIVNLTNDYTCQDTNLFNFIYSSGKYYILTDTANCPNKRLYSLDNVEVIQIRDYPSDEANVIIPSSCENYIDFETSECYSYIPEGFYYNNNTKKIIYKCHSNCKACNKGPTDENNNCLTCPDEGTKYFDLGNCTDSCIHGSFVDIDLIQKCKCTKNIKCEFCTEESNLLDLCISCNNDEGYYIKSDDEERNDNFVNCYKDIEGYYLENKIYKPCYLSCKNCSGSGNEVINNCLACKEGYEVKNDIEGDNNCYKICPYNYYYDLNNNNKYVCTTNDNCPHDYTKLISEKKRCIDNCINDNIYKLEYNNICVSNCPSGSDENTEEKKCESDLNCEQKGKYYNYEFTACIEVIEEGYYCNNTLLNTIDKCHSNCKTCNKGPTDENNNCLTCPDEGTKYFDLGNCKEICNNGNFEENSVKKCKCSTNITCNYCSEESKQKNLCESCNTEEGYYPKNNDENNIGSFINCYNEETIFCTYNYYLNNSKYFCTENDSCPNEYSYFIKDKRKCIDNCIKDNKYKFIFENNCYELCPENTTNSTNNTNICEARKETISEVLIKEIDHLIGDFPPVENITCENSVDVNETEEYTIYIYLNNECAEIPSVDFGECYEKIKEENVIDEDDELIISKIIIKQNNTSVYSFYHPYTFHKLDTTSCQGQKITVQEDVSQKINDNLKKNEKGQLILDLIEQGINVFNETDAFYTDICYPYDSPNGKDIPLKVRIAAFFPNITLCENGCENVGVNLEEKKARCECKFIDLVNFDFMSDTLYGKAIQEFLDIISELNLGVFKCIKDIFKSKNFLRNTGGFIILILFMGQFASFIAYTVVGLYYIRKYIFDLIKSYINYIGEYQFKNNLNEPPRKRRKRRKKISIKENSSSQSKRSLYPFKTFSKKFMNESSGKRKSTLNNHKDSLLNQHNHKITIFENKITINDKKKESKFDMKEYLSLSFDENDFDDVIEKEKRPFCSYFCEKFKTGQLFINSFYIKDPLRPRSLKILVLITNIELYFLINAIFYNEDYLTDLFYSTEEEKFYSFIPRRLNEFIYTLSVSGIISYFVGYFFVDEEKIKKVFRRNKGGELKLKYEISLIVQDIQNKFTTLIVFSFIVTIICFIYISCFFNVYPCIRVEWIKSSLFIIILMQIINLLLTLIQSLLRYISIRFNSERIFKLSEIFSL